MLISAMRSLACENSSAISPYSYVFQNSRFAEPCKSLRTRSGSFTPGSSTMIRPDCGRRWMFGCVTPKRSIRARSTMKALLNADSVSSRSAAITSALVGLFLLSCSLRKMVESLALAGATSLKDCSNSVMKSLWERYCFSFASFIVLTNSESFAPLPANEVTMLGTETSKVTFIPPLRSRPRLISLSLHSLYDSFGR